LRVASASKEASKRKLGGWIPSFRLSVANEDGTDMSSSMFVGEHSLLASSLRQSNALLLNVSSWTAPHPEEIWSRERRNELGGRTRTRSSPIDESFVYPDEATSIFPDLLAVVFPDGRTICEPQAIADFTTSLSDKFIALSLHLREESSNLRDRLSSRPAADPPTLLLPNSSGTSAASERSLAKFRLSEYWR